MAILSFRLYGLKMSFTFIDVLYFQENADIEFSGKSIKILVNQKMEAGLYCIDIVASNLAPGICIYRMKVGTGKAIGF
jgi:hypothetical protein